MYHLLFHVLLGFEISLFLLGGDFFGQGGGVDWVLAFDSTKLYLQNYQREGNRNKIFKFFFL